jgi:Cadherin-like beta sandwich domain/IPT/TIG domain/Divergent InlB B-repeat domain
MLRASMMRRFGGGTSGTFSLLGLAAAVVVVLGGGASARAGNTPGIASITGGGATAILIGSEYDLFLPDTYVQSTVSVTVTAASGADKVSIGLQNSLTSSPDTFSVAVNSGSTISVCTAAASNPGDGAHCDFFQFGVFPTDNFDSNLKAFSVSPGGISFAWSLSNEATTYATRVAANTASVTINAAPEDPLASIKINGQAGGSHSVAINAHGLTAIPVVVTAADGTDTTTYTINVTAGNNDATLSNLTISPGAVVNFSSATTSYDVAVPSNATQVNITPTLHDPNAFWYIDLKPNNTQVQTETDTLPHPIALNVTDPTIVYVGVEAEDTLTYGAYFITITHLVSRTLNVTTSGIGSGVVTSTSPDTVVNCVSPNTGTCTSHYDETSSVTLSEQPAVGSYFVGWSGDCAGTNGTSTFTMPSRTATCTAQFATLGAKQTSPFKVTTGVDKSYGACYQNWCSLRDALAAASGAGGTINFANGVNTITPTTDFLYSGKTVTINGNGVEIDGGSVFDAPTFVFGGVTNVTMNNLLIDNNQNGSGIDFEAGTLTLVNVSLDNNGVEEAAGIFSHGTLTMTGGEIANNGAEDCAGFEIGGGSATFTHVDVHDNFADDAGAGGCVTGGALTMNGGDVDSNDAGNGGGGIFEGTGTLTVNGTLFASNQTPGNGGALFVLGGTATLTNAMVAGNFGDGTIGAVSSGVVDLVSSTVGDNNTGISGQITLLDTIVADNGTDCGSGLTSLGHNLTGASCSFTGTGDVTVSRNVFGAPTSGGLLPLANGSQALDAGISGTGSGLSVPTKDEVGTSRPQGGGVDIGAMEMPEHKLTIKTAGPGTGTVAPADPATPAAGIASPGGWYVAGSSEQLTATPTDGNAFAGWSGACTGNANPVEVVISADETCTATFAAKPIVTSFSPASGRVGTTVTIKGSKFTGVTGVSFGDMPAASFKVVSDTQITAVVPINAATGVITVTDASLSTDSAGTFTYTWVKPVVTSFTPATGKAGTPVTITGTDFLGTTEVDFSGTPGTGLDVVSDTKIIVDVPANPLDGPLGVVNPGGAGVSKTSFTFLPPPTMSNFAPEHAAFGATITITGGHFTGTTGVKIGGLAATFKVVDDGHITATVPTGASNTPAPISVTNAAGTVLSADNFTLDWATPSIASFTPTTARIGATVTINGANFTRASEADFGTHAAQTFTVVSDTKITVVVPGNVGTSPVTITVNRPGGSPGTSVTNFTPLWPKPTITSFTPTSGKAGTPVTVTGTGFLGATELDFSGTPGTGLDVVSDTKIIVDVPANPLDGPLGVVGPGGPGVSKTSFTFLPPPTMSNFAPENAAFGTTITITGGHFTGTTGVKIGGIAATFKVIDDGDITATVPTGASNTPAPITVTNAAGTVLSADNFTLDWATPSIASFTPTTARIGATVTVNGTNFARASEVDFGTHTAPTFTVVSDTKITVVVPGNVGTSPVTITVKRPGGTPGTSATNFTPLWPKPTITSFTPTSAKAGVTMTINGTGFLGVTEVDLGPATAAIVGTPTDTKIVVTVPANPDASGKVSVTTPGGTGHSTTSFLYLPPPTLSSFAPEHAAFGATVTITGSHLNGTTAVQIGGVAATFKVVDDAHITATVPIGASNTPAPITVTNAGGTSPSADNFTLDWATPTIASFTPASGRIGATVTITGTGFTRASEVDFGSVHDATFTIVSATSIKVVVPADVAGTAVHIAVDNPGGPGTPSSALFTPTFPKPAITSFTPTSGIATITVTITGTGFLGATDVEIGGVSALSFTVVSDTKITVVVPTLAVTGKISVVTLGGTGTSAGTFTISA